MRDFGLRILDFGFGWRRHAPVRAHHPHSKIQNPKSKIPPRRGVTLIELLITMAIMAIISAAILGTASAAMESARRTRTQSLVTKIQTLLTERLASYQTRRIDLDGNIVSAINGMDPTLRGKAMADMRLLGVRELVKYEMPDRWNDINDDRMFLSAVPASAQTMRRRFDQITENSSAADIAQHQGAECLYLTVMLNTADGEARTLFSKQDIGDADGDGAPEFIDGWGNPIAWIRWPAGFIVRSPLMSADAQADRDPFDMYRRDDPASTRPNIDMYPSSVRPYVVRLQDDMAAFRLVPLVYSSGSDGISDINTLGNMSVMDSTIALDPYALEEQSQRYDPIENPFQVGFPVDDANNPDGDDNSVDNIHSHLNEY